MKFIEILYLLSSMCALSACIPQLMQLFRTKQAEDFNLATWGLWAMTHTMSLIYMMSIKNMVLIIITAGWLGFYVLMASLIVLYRRRTPLQPAPVYIDEQFEA